MSWTRPRVADRRNKSLGTTTVEIKSGYGLTVADEVRSLQIAPRQFTTETTFLGAHVIPAEYVHDRARYVDLVTGPMLQANATVCALIDVFCEPHSAHAFDAAEARRILTAGAEAGLGLRVHANRWVQALAFSWRSSSARPASITAPTLATPMWMRFPRFRCGHHSGHACFPELNSRTRSPYPDAARLLAAGVSLALATDCNPGPVTPAPCPG